MTCEKLRSIAGFNHQTSQINSPNKTDSSQHTSSNFGNFLRQFGISIGLYLPLYVMPDLLLCLDLMLATPGLNFVPVLGYKWKDSSGILYQCPNLQTQFLRKQTQNANFQALKTSVLGLSSWKNWSINSGTGCPVRTSYITVWKELFWIHAKGTICEFWFGTANFCRGRRGFKKLVFERPQLL